MDLSLGEITRIGVIFVGFIAVWSLLVAFRERHHLWTSKMMGLWVVQLGWPLAVIQGNIELFYRGVNPTFALFWVFLLLLATIYFAMSGETYTKDSESK